VTYKAVFSPGTMMRKRFDAVIAGEPDPHPGTSGSEDVEKMMNALAAGRENPYGVIRLETKVRERKPEEYPVVRPVALAFMDAFEILKEG
jgi:hypothetical protein